MNIQISLTIPLPLPPSAQPLPKPSAQDLLHAAEELYFFRRYAEAASFVTRVLDDKDGAGEARVDGETKRLLRYYRGRCEERLENDGSS